MGTPRNTSATPCEPVLESGDNASAEWGEVQDEDTLHHDTTSTTRRIVPPPWGRLGKRTRTMLQWVNETGLLREADLVSLVWPEPVSRQAQEEALERWQQRRLIQPILEAGERCYQLDAVGAKVLRNAGFARVAPTQPLLPRVRPGVLLANRVGASILSGARHDPRVTGVAWLMRPFSGNSARSDGVAAVRWLHNVQPTAGQGAAPWLPELLADDVPVEPGSGVQRLVVEIDAGTETQRQLAERARRWRALWDGAPPAVETIFLWITTGSPARLDTIWEAWIGQAFLPAFFATHADLAADGAPWRPWEPLRFEDGHYRWLWRDLYGRPRSLKPWELNEPRWRTEAMQPITLPSLGVSIAEWDRVFPAPRY